MSPFVPKIQEAEKNKLAHQQRFLANREEALEKVKGYSGLKSIERSFIETADPMITSPRGNRMNKSYHQTDRFGNDHLNMSMQDELEQKYLDELYTIYTDIETKILSKQKRVVEKSQSLVLYTRNQFLRELKRMMN